jgi:hypothetical protein
MTILRAERLLIKMITLEDASFLLALMNDKDWILNIGDRGIKLFSQATCLFHRSIIHSVYKLTMALFGLSFHRERVGLI